LLRVKIFSRTASFWDSNGFLLKSIPTIDEGDHKSSAEVIALLSQRSVASFIFEKNVYAAYNNRGLITVRETTLSDDKISSQLFPLTVLSSYSRIYF
jgi:hypothetical protein